MLEMFPYPSGSAHMGHVKNYTMGDVIARYRRHQGQRVMHPMGYDAFGLNSENVAIKTGEHPAEFTERAIATINRQLRRLGRRHRLEPRTRYLSARTTTGGPSGSSSSSTTRAWRTRRKRPSTGVRRARRCWRTSRSSPGRCERCDSEVEAKKLRQWFFRITAYAERLLAGLRQARVLAREGHHHAAELDREVAWAPKWSSPSSRGRRRATEAARVGDTDDAVTGTAGRPSSPPVPTRCSGRRSSSWRPSTPWWRTLCAGSAQQARS